MAPLLLPVGPRSPVIRMKVGHISTHPLNTILTHPLPSLSRYLYINTPLSLDTRSKTSLSLPSPPTPFQSTFSIHSIHTPSPYTPFPPCIRIRSKTSPFLPNPPTPFQSTFSIHPIHTPSPYAPFLPCIGTRSKTSLSLPSPPTPFQSTLSIHPIHTPSPYAPFPVLESGQKQAYPCPGLRHGWIVRGGAVGHVSHPTALRPQNTQGKLTITNDLLVF